MKKAICRFLFEKVWGFRFDPVYPTAVKKSVIVIFPHTSNWDFLIGVLTRPSIDLNAKFVGKSSLFKFPFGGFMRWLGGVPVDRSKHNNFVDAVAALYKNSDDLKIGIAPEGTRGKVTSLKTGFYYIALKAEVPLVMCKFDFGKKIVGFSDPFYPTGDFEKDLPQILAYFKGVKGKIHEKAYEIG